MKLLLPTLLLLASHIQAQDTGDLSLYNNWKLNGSVIVTGNNIVSIDAKSPYNDVGNGAKKNDVSSLVYVDIDNDKSTFSSSSADLYFPEHRKIKIIHASLYWTAIYQYGKGIKKKDGYAYRYEMTEPRVAGLNQVKFKMPNRNYLDIQGDILSNRVDSIGKPYLCYADVTQLLQSSEQMHGTYTVANVKATEGYTLGGSAAGWVLYVVYEDLEEPFKNIVTYRGFQSVDSTPIRLHLSGFTSKNKGTVNASLVLGALEGDANIKTDECVIISPRDSTRLRLSSAIRDQDNFFNSTMTYNDKYIEGRLPNSRNTLGFDLNMFKIPNVNNTLLPNKANGLELEFSGNRDKFYLFFVAFMVESSPLEEEHMIVVEEQETFNEKHQSTKDKQLPTDMAEAQKNIRASFHLPSEEAGYYLVTNVFSKKALATQWKSFLHKEGYSPESFNNPNRNNWEYVYILKSEALLDVYKTYLELKQLDYFEKIWILKVTH